MDRKDKKVLTLGIFAHANAGKTTITEHLLYYTNVIDTVGYSNGQYESRKRAWNHCTRFYCFF